MRTLFAISIVALIALLWAAFSMARHIRRTRRSRRQELLTFAGQPATTPDRLDAGPQPSSGPKIEESTPFSVATVSPLATPAVDALLLDQSSASHVEQTVVDDDFSEENAESGSEASATKLRASTSALKAAAEPALASSTDDSTGRLPNIAIATPHSFVPPHPPHIAQPVSEVEAPPKRLDLRLPPGFPAPKTPFTPHPLSRWARRPSDRPDWAYFNKDMGDLTDPDAPRGRPSKVRNTST